MLRSRKVTLPFSFLLVLCVITMFTSANPIPDGLNDGGDDSQGIGPDFPETATEILLPNSDVDVTPVAILANSGINAECSIS